jgi:NADH-quinone oxidoreductase subunit L
MICITLAAAALAGLPPLSGFFSKELILAALAGLSNPVWLAAGLLGAFLTSYYAFRLIFIILFPKKSERPADSDPDHGYGRAIYWVMAWPLMMLAAVSILLGFVHDPLEVFLADRMLYTAGNAGKQFWLPFTALGLAALGVILAWLEFGRSHAAQIGFAERIAPLHALFAERWYLDRIYRRLLDVVIYRTLSNLCTRNDNHVIDGGLDGLSRGTLETGRFVSFLHLGIIQHRLLVISVVMGFLALYFFF